MLTNFKTVKSRVSRLEQLNKIFEEVICGVTKKEGLCYSVREQSNNKPRWCTRA